MIQPQFQFILYILFFQGLHQITISVNKIMKLEKVIDNKLFYTSEIFYPNLFQDKMKFWDNFFFLQISIIFDKKPIFINSLCSFVDNSLNCNINYFSSKNLKDSSPKVEIISGEYESLFKKINLQLISLDTRNYFYVKCFDPIIIQKSIMSIKDNNIKFELGNLNALSPEITKVQKCNIKVSINNETNIDSICEINQHDTYLHCTSYLFGYKIKKIISIFPVNGIFLCENSKIILYLIPLPPSKIYEKNFDFSKYKTDIMAIALYLPQYHTFKENDNFWGKGFTEWTNVRHGFPFFSGHYQPRIPDDSIGYYNLLDINTLKFQAKLAKEHGIYGFGIYYYWFSWKKLMEKPIDLLIVHKEINIKFFLIWANENWTRGWNGKFKDVLISQKYFDEDPKNFIKSLKEYISDERYIKINNKPVIGIYKPLSIPKIKEVVKIWRKTAADIGIGNIFLLVCNNKYLYNEYLKLDLFDGVYDFPPSNHFGDKIKPKIKKIDNRQYKGFFHNFDSVMHFEHSRFNLNDSLLFFRGIVTQWDNSSRKKGINFNSFSINYSLKKFYDFSKEVIKWTRENHVRNNRFIFINAWNEWGEGTYLEPDKIYGYAHINTLSNALFDLPFKGNSKL